LTYRQREQQNDRLLAGRVADFSPDIIYINGMWNLPRSLARKAEQLRPGRVVYYIASPWPAEPDAHAHYWADPAARWWLRRPKQWAGWLARNWLLASGHQLAFERVLCVSGYMQKFIIEQAGIPPANVQVVYNGIDPAEFPLRTRNGRKGLRLLYAGQLTPDKGVHTAVEGLALAAAANSSLPFSLTIVGGGAPEYVESLETSIRELNLAGKVTLIGQVAREEIPGILAAHDVLLFPSIWPEPLARVVQEAMACGLVVIGTTTGGTPELLHDGQTGLTFEAGNATGLARQIGRLAADPNLYDQLALTARETVEACFTQQRMVDEIEACFIRLVQSCE
jgi:glycosyltransferase involved in cell wall biosynthesis